MCITCSVGKEGKTGSETAARCLLHKNNPVNDFWSSFNGEKEEKNLWVQGEVGLMCTHLGTGVTTACGVGKERQARTPG